MKRKLAIFIGMAMLLWVVGCNGSFAQTTARANATWFPPLHAILPVLPIEARSLHDAQTDRAGRQRKTSRCSLSTAGAVYSIAGKDMEHIDHVWMMMVLSAKTTDSDRMVVMLMLWKLATKLIPERSAQKDFARWSQTSLKQQVALVKKGAHKGVVHHTLPDGIKITLNVQVLDNGMALMSYDFRT